MVNRALFHCEYLATTFRLLDWYVGMGFSGKYQYVPNLLREFLPTKPILSTRTRVRHVPYIIVQRIL